MVASVLLQRDLEDIAPLERIVPTGFEVELGAFERFTGSLEHQPAAWLLRHTADVFSLFNDFAPPTHNDGIISSIVLHGIAEAFQSEQHRQAALRALQRPQSEVSEDRWVFTRALLADQEKINGFGGAYLHRAARELPVERTDRFVHSRKNNPLAQGNPRRWVTAKPQHGIGLLQMQRLGAETNVEAIFTDAIKMFAYLREPHRRNEKQVLADIVLAENLHAPLVDTIGFYALSMAMRDNIFTVRMQNAGLGERVDDAAEKLRKIGDRDKLAELTADILRTLVRGDIDWEHTVRDNSGHNAFMAEYILQPEGEKNSVVEVIARRKTAGAFAAKKERSANNSDPVDLLGLTLITKTQEQLAALYAKVVGRAVQDPRILLLSGTQRDEPFHIRGDREYTKSIEVELEKRKDVSLDDVEVVVSKNTFRVVKLTFSINGVSCELQMQTVFDRAESQTGMASHEIYRAQQEGRRITEGYQEDMVGALRELRSRKQLFGRYLLVPASIGRSYVLRDRINAA